MIFLFAGLAILLIAIGGITTTYRNRSTNKRESNKPELKNKYRNDNLLGQAFIEWAELQSAELGAWMGAMETARAKKLLNEVLNFCKKRNFDLAWVIDEQIEDSAVQTSLSQALLQFLQSEHAYDAVHQDLESYVALTDLLKSPGNYKHRQQTQAIYLQLVNQQAIPNGNIAMLFGKDRRRWDNAAKAILDVSYTERPLVNLAVREHILGEVPRAEPSTPSIPPISSPVPQADSLPQEHVV